VRVIPLLDDVAVAEGLDPWPVGALNPSIYKSGIEQRWREILDAESQALWWGKAFGWFGGLVSEHQVAEFAIQKMNEALKEWGLAR
jgi:hypothetical protein